MPAAGRSGRRPRADRRPLPASPGLMQIGEARHAPGSIGVVQCGGLMTKTLSPSAIGNRQRPSASVTTTSRPLRDHHALNAGIAGPAPPARRFGRRTRIRSPRRTFGQAHARGQRQRRSSARCNQLAPRRSPTACIVAPHPAPSCDRARSNHQSVRAAHDRRITAACRLFDSARRAASGVALLQLSQSLCRNAVNLCLAIRRGSRASWRREQRGAWTRPEGPGNRCRHAS